MKIRLNALLDGSIAPDCRAVIDLSGLSAFVMRHIDYCDASEDNDDRYNLVFPDRWTTWEKMSEDGAWYTLDKATRTELVTNRGGAVLRTAAVHGAPGSEQLTTEYLGYAALDACRKLDIELRHRRLERTLVAIESGYAWMVSALNENELPLLHEAIAMDNIDAVQRLLDANAQIDATDGDGVTAIELAVAIQKREIVSVLLARHPELPDDILDGARNGDIYIYHMLIEAGANDPFDPQYMTCELWERAPQCPYCGETFVYARVHGYRYRWEYHWSDTEPCPHLVGFYDLLDHCDGLDPVWTEEERALVFDQLGWGSDEGVETVEWTLCSGCCGPGYNGPSNLGDLGDGTDTGTLYFASNPKAVLRKARSKVSTTI